MTIYFNEKKEAFAYEIENPIATTSQEIWNDYADTDKWDILENKFVDISQTPQYISKITLKEKEKQREELLSQIEILDKKRVRAIAEPELKNPESGETWLDFYTQAIRDLRNKLGTL